MVIKIRIIGLKPIPIGQVEYLTDQTQVYIVYSK